MSGDVIEPVMITSPAESFAPNAERVFATWATISGKLPAPDRHVPLVELPIVGVFVFEAARVESAERVMSEEQRPAEILAKRQLDAPSQKPKV